MHIYIWYESPRRSIETTLRGTSFAVPLGPELHASSSSHFTSFYTIHITKKIQRIPAHVFFIFNGIHHQLKKQQLYHYIPMISFNFPKIEVPWSTPKKWMVHSGQFGKNLQLVLAHRAHWCASCRRWHRAGPTRPPPIPWVFFWWSHRFGSWKSIGFHEPLESWWLIRSLGISCGKTGGLGISSVSYWWVYVDSWCAFDDFYLMWTKGHIINNNIDKHVSVHNIHSLGIAISLTDPARP